MCIEICQKNYKHLWISTLGQLILAAKLDHEAVRFHKLVITVAELESPDLSDSANVTVEVTDVNDNRPTYQNLTYHFEVSLYDYDTYSTCPDKFSCAFFCVSFTNTCLSHVAYQLTFTVGQFVQK